MYQYRRFHVGRILNWELSSTPGQVRRRTSPEKAPLPPFPFCLPAGWRSDVIRLFSIEVALFLAPFILYAVFLWAAREGILHPESWSTGALVQLALVAVALTVAGAIAIARHGGAPAHSTYVPAHIENGELVPGTLK
jgi:hypothetical protein